MLFDLVLYKLG